MVERFHSTLKTALMFRCNSSTWYSQLPWVLLRLWTAPKEGLDLSAAEMVYGNPLVITGEFFPNNNPSPNIIRLQTIVREFAPDCSSYKPTNKTFIPKDLHTATHVHQSDAVRPPSTQPYTGPYQVINHKQKAFFIDIHGPTDWVAVDCPKRAYLPDDNTPPIQFSRAGRPLQCPGQL
ncbi:uncharacterized protein [Macrobrachium rosenbergii]|uniref:uncharacterized protein n=1 Tax=Macrobrachium rosenbergii TaxID=79674 RepID=UPI0034D7A588